MSATMTLIRKQNIDTLMNWPLVLSAVCLMLFGVVMVTSASIGIAETKLGDAFYYGRRHFVYVLMGLMLGFSALRTPTRWLEQLSFVFLLGALVLLVVVLIPGIGVQFHGAHRWIRIAGMTMQPSEFARIALLIYLASYMVRRGDEVRANIKGFLKPWLIIAVMSMLLLAEPDFGATAVLCGTCLGLLFMAGARLRLFVLGFALIVATGAVLVATESYRQSRFAFLDPWKDPYGEAYQLIQSLIAIGSGGFSGLGLGSSVQKLFYLPEAHNDFLFAIMAEELGFMGVCVLIGLYSVLLYQIIKTGARALSVNQQFGAYLCYGIAIWLASQIFINMGVSMGILPTKGLILPLMSSGGSAMMVTCLSLGMVLRVHYESIQLMQMNQSASVKKGPIRELSALQEAVNG